MEWLGLGLGFRLRLDLGLLAHVFNTLSVLDGGNASGEGYRER